MAQRRDAVWITDMAVVCALGDHIDETWEQLIDARSAIRPVDRFDTHGCNSTVAACIPDLKSAGSRSMLWPLISRLIPAIGSVPSDALPVSATTKGGIDMLEQHKYNRPYDDKDVLPSAISPMASQLFGLEHQGISISAACASSAIAVAHAAALIRTGRREVVLVCCADLVTRFVFSGFSALGALSPAPCMPFDRDRNGLSLGEGAAALVLMHKERALAEGKNPLGQVCGWGMANDAFHVTAPHPDGSGLSQAITRAMNQAGIKPEQLCAICAHGTGTVANDAMELEAFSRCFGGPETPWPGVYSLKGAIGHTMGAAGGIEVALGLKTLAQQLLPPTVGLQNPAEGAQGRIFVRPAEIQGEYLLTSNSGFGGTNAAIVLKRGG